MSHTPIRVALLGAGNSGLHYHAIANIIPSADFKLTVVAVGSAASADVARAVLGPDIEVTVGWESAVAHSGVDLAVVALPHHLHEPASIAAMEQGLHVLVEKPMALTTRACDRMIAAAQRAGVVLEIFHQRRFEENTQLALDLVQSGKIGRVWRVEVARFHRGYARTSSKEAPHVGDRVLEWAHQKATGGGISYVVGPHPVDLLLALLDSPVTGVQSRVYRIEGEDVDAWIGLEVDVETGASGRVDVYRSALHSPPRFIVHGTAGTIVANDAQSLEVHRSAGGAEEFGRFALPGCLGGEVYSGLAAAIRGSGALTIGSDTGRSVVDVLDRALASAEQLRLATVR